MGRGLADLLDDSAGPSPSVLAFAALQVSGDFMLDHPTVDLASVHIRLGNCGGNSHEREHDSFSQTKWSPTIGSGFLLRRLRRMRSYQDHPGRLQGVHGGDRLGGAGESGPAHDPGVAEVLRKHFPGCRNARLRAMTPLLTVCETWRIVGDFRSMVQDLVEWREVPRLSASPGLPV